MNAHTLLAALDAVDSEAARAMLLTGTSRAARESLAGLIAYREMTTPNAALAEFKRTLAATSDNAARLALIRGGNPAVIAALCDELSWATATPEECADRYVAMIYTGDDTA
jgi:hypothetical protein